MEPKSETKIQINPIGIVKSGKRIFSIEIFEQYRPALIAMEGFTHLQIIWWGHLFDTPHDRKRLIEEKPYKKGPGKVGIFATHSPVRPNPVLLTTIYVQQIDIVKGIIHTPYIDAENGSPVLDIKPYHLSERVRECAVPGWCSHWPKWYEDAAYFNWRDEFNF